MNRPYVKQYDAEGKLVNPIVGEFINSQPNRQERREDTLNKKRLFNNKKGTQLVITRIGWFKFMKYKKVFQQIGKKRIIHFVEA